jgi:hypothetical protein
VEYAANKPRHRNSSLRLGGGLAASRLSPRDSYPERSLGRTTAYEMDICLQAIGLRRQEAACSRRMKRRSRHISTRKKLCTYNNPFACGKAFKRRSKRRHDRNHGVGFGRIPFLFLSRQGLLSKGDLKVYDMGLRIRRIWDLALSFAYSEYWKNCTSKIGRDVCLESF